jgi:hypothetical protein
MGIPTELLFVGLGIVGVGAGVLLNAGFGLVQTGASFIVEDVLLPLGQDIVCGTLGLGLDIIGDIPDMLLNQKGEKKVDVISFYLGLSTTMEDQIDSSNITMIPQPTQE